MSKLKCQCGHIIVDQTDNIIYKADFIRDRDLESFDKQVVDIASFMSAVKNGEREKWLQKYFSADTYNNLSDESIINDILSKYFAKYSSLLYVCENCGRIKIQKGETTTFLSFSPEQEPDKNIFKGLSES